MADAKRELTGSEIAIIGMACRFPGASDVEQFWRNLAGGVESLTLLTDEDLARNGVPPELIASPGYVRRIPVLDGIEMFDPAFFGYTPLEAKIMDPQHRLFLECSWEVFEQAGYDPETYPAPVGVFTGAKTNTYLFSLFSDRELFRSLDNFQIALGNDLAAMATRVSYKLNLRGPSYALHTACSTSLVAVHLACQSLLLDECRMAVAGGAAINVPQRKGYPYQKGGILSPDGSCRTFDASAAGSNFGNGAGAVLLKRLEDALADGDHIHAVILGSATNNDGAQKASYTAPGVEGQMRVLLEAMACAGVEAEDISYVEAHGTATDLGDSIELLALSEAFRATTDKTGYCAIGSVKTNLGHLETAAGMAGLLKTALALEQRQLPPSLHFERPNPKIDFAGSPFYVNTQLADWPAAGRPRRAGLSSFGIGSTNCHVILEEPPPPVATTAAARPVQLLLLSARTPSALDAMTANLARHLEEHPQTDLADVAWTLHVGRKGFQHRRAVVARDTAGAMAALRGEDGAGRHSGGRGTADRPLVFLFPGLGDHYVDMGLGLYRTEPVFREALDCCAGLLRPELGLDLRNLLYPRGTDAEEAAGDGRPDLRRLLGRAADDEASRRLQETRYAQPAVFAVEYALARLWMEWGVRPQAMIGYSVGEYVAACLAGVLSLEDALRLVARRARLIQELPGGAMTAVPLPEGELAPLLERHGLSLAALNGPAVSVASGPEEDIAALERALAEGGVVCRRLPATHAFHSTMMDAAMAPLTDLVHAVQRCAPQIPYLSNVTGTWITAAEAADPAYWARHMCGAVRFADGVAELLRKGERIFLEVGPGQGLGSFVRLHPDCDKERGRRVVASMRPAQDGRPSPEVLLAALSQLWIHGAAVDWQAFHAGERRRRVPLPTYPFERSPHWVEPVLPEHAADLQGRRVTLDRQADMADWFYRPVWRREGLTSTHAAADAGPLGGGLWLLFRDGSQLGENIAAELRARSRELLSVEAGEAFSVRADGFSIRPGRPEDYIALLDEVMRRGCGLAGIAHLWTLPELDASGEEGFAHTQDLGFYSLLFLAQALGRQALPATVRIEVLSSCVQSVTGGEPLCPEKATLLGPCKVVPQEIARVACRCIDVEVPEAGSAAAGELAAQLAAEVLSGSADEAVAWRGGERWVQGFERVRLERGAGAPALLRDQGVYLLTGGLGGLGLVLAEHLARTVRARLVLTGRSAFPERPQWDLWLAEHPEGDAVSAKIHKLLELESLGAEVLAFAADAADEVRMREVAAAARGRFGAIHGVIHLAGTPGGGIVQLKTREAADRIAAPKVRGARVLDALFRGAGLDFLVLFSSIASVLGEFGQVDYCGANAFLDAFALRNAQRGGPPTLAVDWDIWREAGLAVYTEVPAHLRPWRQEMLEKAMLSAEGVEAFDRILHGGLPRTVVSVQELHGRIELGKSFTGESFLAELEKARGAPARPPAAAAAAGGVPREGLEAAVAEVWRRVLGVPEVGLQDNFFDIGGNSLLGLQLVSELSRELGVQIAPVALFESPTVAALARHLAPEPETAAGPPVELAERRKRLRKRDGRSDIAIIGLAGRFPGARNVEELWQNLRLGLESVTFFTDEELLAAGVAPEVLSDPRYVRAGSILEGIDQFDAGLFGYSPREAEIIDPQHRIFLETCWELFERAGYDPESYPGAIGIFAGSNLSTYLMRLYGDPDVRGSVNMLQAILGNDKDSLTTTVSYKMNLRGPSVAVQTFCSTSLVAVHMAGRSLRDGECDMAVAGGIRVVVPDYQGYLYEHGGIAPSDGHSRSFDAKANGSVLGHGVGAVLLKRLDDALADGDRIHAVIKGSAVNNDGSLKAGYTAPSVAGQSDAIAAALEDAGVHPESLSYVEAHGSATELGDPIEVAALTRAWRRFTDRTGICPIGSVKSNFGHLDRAAGVTGLIKTVLSLEHGEIPPSILFDEPNPKIDFASSPFYVNSSLAPWPAHGAPRRAAVNSLGMGGTNVHVILEEAPPATPSGPSRPWQLLLLSARTETALDAVTRHLAEHLEAHPETDLADAAFTLQAGRKHQEMRRILVCRDTADAAAALAGGDPRRLPGAWTRKGERPVVFLFSGLGGQYVNMGRGLYESEEVFRAEIDCCASVLEPLLGLDLRAVLYPPEAPAEAGAEGGVDLRKMLRRGDPGGGAAGRLDETRLAHPALCAVEYALARLWMSWGVQPQALVGYSLGEYVAACLAGVLSLRDALTLVADRARRIQELPAGAMLAVALPEAEVLPLLGEELSLAAVNGPEQTVAAGPVAAVEELERLLAGRGVAVRRLQVSHAFHSRMMEPIGGAFAEQVRGVTLRPPKIPLLSDLTGAWMTAEEATDPTYWSRHLCGTVRFSAGIVELLRDRQRVLLEIGPGPTLASLVLQHPASRGEDGAEAAVLGSLRHSYETQPDLACILTALGKLWLLGARIDWKDFWAGEQRRRLLLPTYPFERQRYWIDTVEGGHGARSLPAPEGGGWAYAATWKRGVAPDATPRRAGGVWLILADGAGLGDAVAAELRRRGDRAAILRAGAPAGRLGEDDFVVDPASPDWAAPLDTLGEVPARVIHLWSLHNEGAALQALAREIAERAAGAPLRVWAAVDRLHDVTGDEELRPEGAAALAALRQIRRELPEVDGRCIDMVVGQVVNGSGELLARRLLAEIEGGRPERLVALRGNHRWVPLLDALPEPAGEPLREGGVWVVANGRNEIGSAFTGFLERAGARLVPLEPGLDLAALGAVDGVLCVATAEGAEERARDLATLDELLRERPAARGWLVVAEEEAAGALDPAGALSLEAFAAASGGRWASVAWALPAAEPGAAPRDGLVRRLLAAGMGRTIVAPRPLAAGWSRLEEIASATPAGRREAVGFYPRPALRVDYVAPRNPVEEYVAAIWKDLLGVAQVGIYDNFLDLGGDSLLATRLVSRMRDVFELELPVRLFFERPTVAELADTVAQMQKERRQAEGAELLEKVQGLSEEELEREIMRLEKLLAAGEVADG